MPTQIYNTASLTFQYGSQKGCVSSNVAVTTLQDLLTVSKTSLGDSYSQNSEITFIISINNNNNSVIKNIKIEDDMGTYCLGQDICDASFTPLTYIGPSILYIGGVFSANIEPKISSGKILFEISNIPARSNALIIYKTVANNFAQLVSGSKIISTVSISSDEISKTITDSSTLNIKDEADIRIIKNMNPNPILTGEKITYNFSLYNYGNTEATNVTLNDTFSPAPNTVNVYLNSQELTTSDFSYANSTLTIPSYNSNISISIPAANFIQDNITGLISIEPGITSIMVTGQI